MSDYAKGTDTYMESVLGILTGLFRLFGGSAEGVSYAIIISNLNCTIDREELLSQNHLVKEERNNE